MKSHVVASGVDSEYVLAELAQFLREQGHRVTELDFGKIDVCVRPLLASLSHEKTAYITSAHTCLSRRVAKFAAPMFDKLYPFYLAPIEILPILRPATSIFVPHDLLTPFGDTNLNEIQFLDLYDHVLAPVLTHDLVEELGISTQLHSAGWIKYRQRETPAERIPMAKSRPRATLFISMIQHMQFKYGPQGFVDYLRPILAPDINVKLPAWKGVEVIEQMIRKQTGAYVIPAEVSSIDLIQASDVVICNTVSSVLAEASMMGVPSVCLLDNEGYEADEKKGKMSNFPSLAWHSYFDQAPFPKGFLANLAATPLSRQIEPFSFSHVQSLIEAA